MNLLSAGLSIVRGLAGQPVDHIVDFDFFGHHDTPAFHHHIDTQSHTPDIHFTPLTADITFNGHHASAVHLPGDHGLLASIFGDHAQADVGTTSPNGGPSNDPDLANIHSSENALINPFDPKTGEIKSMSDDLRFGTTGENGGPNPDPDRPNADRIEPSLDTASLDGEGGPGPNSPGGEGHGDPDSVSSLFSASATGRDVGTTSPNGGPSNDPNRVDIHGMTPEEHREFVRRRVYEI